jgi:hypothetical protein
MKQRREELPRRSFVSPAQATSTASVRTTSCNSFSVVTTVRVQVATVPQLGGCLRILQVARHEPWRAHDTSPPCAETLRSEKAGTSARRITHADYIEVSNKTPLATGGSGKTRRPAGNRVFLLIALFAGSDFRCFIACGSSPPRSLTSVRRCERNSSVWISTIDQQGCDRIYFGIGPDEGLHFDHMRQVQRGEGDRPAFGTQTCFQGRAC